jgi:hypothetical protein
MSRVGDVDREFITRSVRRGITLLVVAATCFALLWVFKAWMLKLAPERYQDVVGEKASTIDFSLCERILCAV